MYWRERLEGVRETHKEAGREESYRFRKSDDLHRETFYRCPCCEGPVSRHPKDLEWLWRDYLDRLVGFATCGACGYVFPARMAQVESDGDLWERTLSELEARVVGVVHRVASEEALLSGGKRRRKASGTSKGRVRP